MTIKPESVVDDGLTPIGCAILMVCPILGVLAGFLFLFPYDVAIERFAPLKPGQSMISHGFYGVLTTLPLCIAIGFGGGISVGLIIVRQPIAALAVLAIFCSGVLWINAILWHSWVTTYGPDYSELKLFYPPIVLTGIVLLTLIPFVIQSLYIVLRAEM